MSSTRSFLFAALVLVGFLLWQAWQQDYETKSATPDIATAPTTSTGTPAVSEVPKAAGVPTAPAASTKPLSDQAPTELIDVRTDLLRVSIDTRGGALVRADLLAYPLDPQDKSKPVRLLDDRASSFFVAQSGLVSATGP